MKKTIVMLAAVALVSGVYADIFANPFFGYGVGGNGNGGGIVNNTQGTLIVMQVINGGGDGLDYVAPGIVNYNQPGGVFDLAGNDSLIGTVFGTVSATPGSDYSDFGTLIAGSVGGFGTPWVADTYVRVSGIGQNDWVWESAVAFTDGDYSDPKTLPENVDVDGSVAVSADGSVTVNVIPEPATIGLMGIAGLGLFLARKKARS